MKLHILKKTCYYLFSSCSQAKGHKQQRFGPTADITCQNQIRNVQEGPDYRRKNKQILQNSGTYQLVFCYQYYYMEYLQGLKDTVFATPTCSAFTAYLIYYSYICIASLVLPSTIVKGHPQPKRGPQLEYSICGFRMTILTLFIVVAFGGVCPSLAPIQLFQVSALVKQFWPLWSAVNIFALIVSTLLYLKGKYGIQVLGEIVDNHTHGSFGTDFGIGRQLNPRIGSFDIKFVAYRVAMIFWLVLNLSFLALQIQKHGYVTARMWAYQLSTGIYILDYTWNEPKMLTTWDIISEEFGYMLVFGDYVFIPFVFTIQCHYLVDCPDFPLLCALPIVLLYLLGYYIFRTSNSQKNQFKTNPQLEIWGKKPETVGGKLLISGFWGMGRHMNYTGDLIMAIGYCLPCGLQLGGYTYFIYLFILLTHRAYRDDSKCRQKYKQLWEEYVNKVPYVFVPFQPLDKVFRAIGKGMYDMSEKKQQNSAPKAQKNQEKAE